jgi:hypothetical protein
LSLIGEDFEDTGRMVNGAVVSIRPKGDKICLWLRDSGPRDLVLKVQYLAPDHTKSQSYGLHLRRQRCEKL